ncbi:Hypothetical_protein [Hexamita inflata]|uniref:Hypothetical_protein n=1 Tax=Hexamita inflata TaxID=28002 RepID=A0AA86NCI4_9EUKA|nr:Hypothetical protein HINF_LOCUS4822 [Hexamita inflata]CAI9919955.1 Hypothetical protein HINF_LOCUS7600 [Hexamita inflata]CAI9971968.1 Hypothetical protein HINF_LOCUS59613 [Hexamita inflata]
MNKRSHSMNQYLPQKLKKSSVANEQIKRQISMNINSIAEMEEPEPQLNIKPFRVAFKQSLNIDESVSCELQWDQTSKYNVMMKKITVVNGITKQQPITIKTKNTLTLSQEQEQLMQQMFNELDCQ